MSPPRAHIADFNYRLRLIRIVWEHQNRPYNNWFKFKFCGFITPYVLASACFGTFVSNIFYFWNHFVWRRMTDVGSLPEMRIWSIFLIKSDSKLCIHLSKGSLYISTTWWVALLVDQWVHGIANSPVKLLFDPKQIATQAIWPLGGLSDIQLDARRKSRKI